MQKQYLIQINDECIVRGQIWNKKLSVTLMDDSPETSVNRFYFKSKYYTLCNFDNNFWCKKLWRFFRYVANYLVYIQFFFTNQKITFLWNNQLS